ncbi:MAG: glycosyltransferase [Candidatus Eisenbacteria bacterium]|nr:glycosyltransferase [Candidatus Eisenbacteria bacterium]
MSATVGVSVIIVNFNGGGKVVETLRAIVREADGLDAEIVVVDNASGDGSPDRIAEALPGVRLVRGQENRGYAAGVNRGLEAARGDVYIIMNADVAPTPGSLEALARAVRAERGFGLFGGVALTRSGRPDPNSFRALPRPIDILREAVFLPPRRGVRSPVGAATAAGVVETEAVSGSVMALRRETLTALGPMDEGFFLYSEDVEWCRRARRKGLRVAVVPAATFRHDGGASTSGVEAQAFTARVLSDFRYFCDGEGVPASRVRALWRARAALRAWLYATLAFLGPRGRRRSSARRGAIYRLLSRALGRFRWDAPWEGQPGHPSRLVDLPAQLPRTPDDRRPTVLMVTPNMEYGGSQRLIEALVLGPARESYRFEILCLTHVGPIGERLRRRGVPVHLVGMSGWRRPGEWMVAADVAALLDADLVHSHLLPGDVAAFLGFRGRAPVVSTKHGVDEAFPWWGRLVEWLVLRRACAVLAVSDAVAEAKSYLGRCGALPEVIESPPTVPFADAPVERLVPGRPVRLAMVARLHPVKRVDLFLEAVAELERVRPAAFSCSVIGEGREGERLRRLAGDLGIAHMVRFAGAVDDVAAELDRADIVLLLSDHEGLGLAVLDALARGSVPIVRRVSGAAEALPASLEDCFVDSAAPADIARKILEVSDDPRRFLALVDIGRAWLTRRADYGSAMATVYGTHLRAAGQAAKTRVLYVITRLIVGGAQEHTIASVARVDPTRFESHLWIGPQTGPEGSLRADARSRGIVVRVFPRLVREVSPWDDVRVTAELLVQMRRGAFDIVHTNSSKAGIVGRVAARLAGVPHIVHTVHGWGFHDRMRPAVRRLYVLLERFMQPWTRPLVAVSNRTIRIGLEHGIGRPEAYRLVRSGIPMDAFSPDREIGRSVRARLGVGDGELLVGSVGRLSPQKNPLDFVRVAEGLLKRHANARFLYVGDGPLRAEVERAVADAGIKDRVLLPGIRGDVPDLLRAMDVLVMTSLWEGLPRVIPQALATGVPVVSYDISGIDECVHDGLNGYLVPEGAVDVMVDRLALLARDTALRAEMVRRAREDLDPSFTEDAMIRELEGVYEELTGDRDEHRAQGREAMGGIEPKDRSSP